MLKRRTAVQLMSALLLLFCLNHASAQTVKQTPPPRILFIGNSLTSFNDLPQLIQQIAQSKGHALTYQSHLMGGATLKRHANDPTLQQKLQTPWDIIVLQEQSQRTAFPQAQLKKIVFPYAKQLIQQARLHSPHVKIVFYMTMAHKHGDQKNKATIPEIGTYTGMQLNSSKAYMQLAADNQAYVAPVGVVWSQMRQKHPQTELYTDDRHPNLAGSYLTACVFLSTVFQESCKNGYTPPALNESITRSIQNLIAEML